MGPVAWLFASATWLIRSDTCWAFGFANLEQSRVPQWMIHPILNLPEAGPFNSNFAEAIIQPGWQPNYWPEQE